ncbi:hypothetical protein HQ43_00860 [Porphyromonas canoris]|uniref:Uncharacterized protein n=1 Tax=Porphyromonas canoris TaxID=36875 RepID=A0ABR4XMV0_9PORP|nr:hypothetical protein HQ43_00860 [Porphyromonas canoris]
MNLLYSLKQTLTVAKQAVSFCGASREFCKAGHEFCKSSRESGKTRLSFDLLYRLEQPLSRFGECSEQLRRKKSFGRRHPDRHLKKKEDAP